jgi:hypothetical protein
LARGTTCEQIQLASLYSCLTQKVPTAQVFDVGLEHARLLEEWLPTTPGLYLIRLQRTTTVEVDVGYGKGLKAGRLETEV